MIQIKNLVKIYNDKKSDKIIAIKDLALNLPSRGLIFITGKSGCGKSTLLNLIGGLDSYDNGDIIINNQSLKKFSSKDFESYRNTCVGFIFQEYNLLEDYTVKKNIEFALDLQGIKTNDDEISKVLHDVDLDGLLHRNIQQLSGGQKQRVAIARALIKKPKMLLCDEPTGSLDSQTGEAIFELLKKLSKNTLVIVASHDKDNAFKYGDRVIELKDGEIQNDEEINVSYTEIISSKNLLKAHNLPLKKSFLFSLHYLKQNPVRLCISIIISTILFIILSISSIYSSYNREDIILKSMYKSGNNVVTFQLNESGYLFDDPNRIDEINRNMSNEDIENLKEYLDINEIDVVYDLYNNSIQRNLASYSADKNKNNLYDLTNYGLVEIDENFISRYGFKLYGSLPRKNSEDNEVVITKYYFDLFKKFDYLAYDHKVVKINEFDELIGKDILMKDELLGENTLKIVGILDTNYAEMYSKNQTIHSVFYVRNGFYDDNVLLNGCLQIGSANNRYIKIEPSNSSTVIKNEHGLLYLDYYDIKVEKIVNYNDLSNLNIYWLDENKTELTNNDVIIPIGSVELMSKNVIEIQTKSLIQQFCNSHYEEIRNIFISDNHIDSSIIYADYIVNNEYNKYHLGYDYKYFYDMVFNSILNNVFKNGYTNFLTIDMEFNALNHNINIVGVYDDNIENLPFKQNDNAIIIANDGMNQIIDKLGKFSSYYSNIISPKYFYKYAFIPLTGEYEIDMKRIEIDFQVKKMDLYIDPLYEIETDSFYYSINCEVKRATTNADLYLSINSSLFTYLTIALIVLSIGFTYYYISGLIINKKKEIGIMRSLGAKKMDIVKIFIINVLFISVITIILSSILSSIYIDYVNNDLIFKYNLLISILNFTFKQVFQIILLELVISCISIFMPLIKIMKKNPINIMNNN